MNKKIKNNYLKSNNCPYCGYFCDSATMIDKKRSIPKVGDLSFCLMCCGSIQFGKDMKLTKFDLNSIKNINERVRLKAIQSKMELFWELNPDKDENRVHFLNVRDGLKTL